MRAGRLRHRLVLQSKTYTANAYGEQIVAWSTEATVWGAIEPLSARELFSQSQIQPEARVRIVLRYYTGLDHTWRITNGGLYYDIVEVINHDTRDAMLTLLCRQGVSEDVGADSGSFLLLESGDYLLLESGDKLILEG